MIGFFPQIYPGELLYSWFARYYSRAGYTAYRDAVADLYERHTVRPDVEFINRLDKGAEKIISGMEPMEKLVLEHTMFPNYGRFLDAGRRQKAFQCMVRQEGDAHNLLVIPVNRSGSVRYVRYCPVCVTEDRMKYGETFIHRVHQLMGIDICCQHRCKLKDSVIPIMGKAAPRLYVLDNEIVDMEVEPVESEIALHLAQYMTETFLADMDMENTVDIGEFLHSRLAGTQYVSVRGEQRNLSLFHQDYEEYYQGFPKYKVMELWQIQKIFNGYRKNAYEICQLAMFLKIPVDELVHRRLPEKTQEQTFDEKVRELHEQGLSYPQIAEQLGASINVVKPIGENRYGNQGKPRQHSGKGGIKGYDWMQIDKDTLPAVKDAARKIYTGDGGRPHRVNAYAVGKELGISDRKLKTMPQCMAVIESYQETQEQYWAREVVWAVSQVQKSRDVLLWRRIRDLTNMRRMDFESCLPYLDEFIDSGLAEQIRNLLL